MSDEFNQLAINRLVKDLFAGRSFSICDVDQLAKLMGVSVERKTYNQLSAYHCVAFSELSGREKELIQSKVVECLRGDRVLNPARVLAELTDEGGDFTFTEDRYIDKPKKKKNIFRIG